MELKPIKTKKIYEEIVDQIRELIYTGQLKPGDRIPSERTLVESFKVSRASIREALSALELMGILEVRSVKGTFVKELRTESIVEPLAWVLSMDKVTSIELLEVRKILEVQAVEIAAQRITDEELDELYLSLETMREADLDRNKSGEHADLQFHYIITKATKNKILVRLMDTIADLMKKVLKESRLKFYNEKATSLLLYQEHLQIYEALKAANPERAKMEMIQHLNRVEHEFTKSYLETVS